MSALARGSGGHGPRGCDSETTGHTTLDGTTHHVRTKQRLRGLSVGRYREHAVAERRRLAA